MAAVLTICGWYDRISDRNAAINEAFSDEFMLKKADIDAISKANAPKPTTDQAVQAHQTLLRFISDDFQQGIKFVNDFGNRFYGNNMPLRKDLDTRRLMDNYVSPLQGL